jgi:hypothetical protein
MKTLILALCAALSLGVGVANAGNLGQATPQQSGNQFNWTAVGAGWG